MFKRLIAIWKLSKFTTDNRVNHIITDKDREESHAVRSLKKQVKVLEEINEKQQETIKHLVASQKVSKGDMTENLISMALPLLMSKIGSEDKPKVEQQQEQKILNTSNVSFNEEQIKALINANPKLKQYAHQFKDEDIKNYIKHQIPNIDEESINKIIKEVRN